MGDPTQQQRYGQSGGGEDPKHFAAPFGQDALTRATPTLMASGNPAIRRDVSMRTMPSAVEAAVSVRFQSDASLSGGRSRHFCSVSAKSSRNAG